MKIDHLNIVASDLERTVDFYSRLLGLVPTFRRRLEGSWLDRVTGLTGACAECVFLEAPGGDCRLEVLQYVAPQPAPLPGHSSPNALGLRHLAFAAPDLAPVLERLSEMKLKPLSDPVTVPFPVGSLGRKQICYLHDPDGVLIELAAYEKAADP